MRQRPRPDGVTQLGSGHAPESRFLASTATKSGEVVSPALLALSERQFQAYVRAALESRGFTVWAFPNMRLTTAGVPDLTFWHPARPGRVYAWELKRERDYRVTPKQAAALTHLRTVDGIDARIVRPSEWPALRDALDEGEG